MAWAISESVTASVDNGATQNSLDFTLSTSPSSGDMLILAIGTNGGSWPGRQFAEGTDWVALEEVETSGEGDGLQLFYRYCDGTEGTSIEVEVDGLNYTDGSGVLLHVTGLEDPSTTAPASGTTTPIAPGSGDATAPSITSPADDSLLLAILINGGGACDQNGSPSGYTYTDSIEAGTGSVVVWRKNAASGATGTATMPYTPTWPNVNTYVACHAAFAPSGGAPSFVPYPFSRGLRGGNAALSGGLA